MNVQLKHKFSDQIVNLALFLKNTKAPLNRTGIPAYAFYIGTVAASALYMRMQ